MTGWTWARYSYAWDVTDTFRFPDTPSLGPGRLVGRYVEVRRGPDSDRHSTIYHGDVYPYEERSLLRDVVFVRHDPGLFVVIVHRGEGRQALSRRKWKGPMGCFIFGLYLRRWLVERNALAGGTPRNMIA
jgi:hypothetical protein